MTYDDDYITDRERRISRWLAIAMHAAFVLLLVFGVAWQKRHSEPAAIVDLWSSLPPPRPEPVPAPRPEIRPEPRPEPRPAPKPEAKPLPKPDIALKEKLEKEKRLKEQLELEKKKQLDQQKRKEEEAKKLKAEQLEAKKKEDEKRKLEKERLAQEAELKRLAQEKQAAADRLAKEQAAAQSRALDDAVRQIQNKIRRNIIEPPNLQGNPTVEFEVRILPGGEIVEDSLRLRRSSGVPAYDEAVQRAILRSSPLPMPSDPAVYDKLRNPTLRIRPRE